MSCMFLEVSAVTPIREAPGRFPSVSVGSQLVPAQNNPYTISESGTEFRTPLVLLKSWPLWPMRSSLHYCRDSGLLRVSRSRTCGLVITGNGYVSRRSWT